MLKIRRGVFETNSSSTHSISIVSGLAPDGVALSAEELEMLNRLDGGKGLLDCSMVPDDDGVLRIDGFTTEFGWEIETYSDARTKAMYCYIDQYARKDRLRMLEEVLTEQTKATAVEFLCDPVSDLEAYEHKYNREGYIDHQSRGTSDSAFDSKEKLRNFIFNKHSTLRTDNDNK